MRAYKVQKIIKKTGFDFATPSDAEAKILEEVKEFDSATSPEEREKEGGDMLFAVVNTLRMCDIDPETALNGTTNRFIKISLRREKVPRSGRRTHEREYRRDGKILSGSQEIRG